MGGKVTDSPRWRCSLCGAEELRGLPEANQAAAVKHTETHQGFKVGDRVQHKDFETRGKVGYVRGVTVTYDVLWDGENHDIDRRYLAEDLVTPTPRRGTGASPPERFEGPRRTPPTPSLATPRPRRGQQARLAKPHLGFQSTQSNQSSRSWGTSCPVSSKHAFVQPPKNPCQPLVARRNRFVGHPPRDNRTISPSSGTSVKVRSDGHDPRSLLEGRMNPARKTIQRGHEMCREEGLEEHDRQDHEDEESEADRAWRAAPSPIDTHTRERPGLNISRPVHHLSQRTNPRHWLLVRIKRPTAALIGAWRVGWERAGTVVALVVETSLLHGITVGIVPGAVIQTTARVRVGHDDRHPCTAFINTSTLE